MGDFTDFVKALGTGAAMLVCVLLFVAAVTAPLAWMSAGAQQRVYARQGIDITRWELFWGATPATQTVRLHTQPESP